MRVILLGLTVGLFVANGCASRKDAAGENGDANASRSTPIIRPINVLSGKVVMVNPALRYVVIDFSVGSVPQVDQHLAAYRKGQKVGIVKISAQAKGSTVAADIIQGDVEKGDEILSE